VKTIAAGRWRATIHAEISTHPAETATDRNLASIHKKSIAAVWPNH
jgi:hypothetical protein